MRPLIEFFRLVPDLFPSLTSHFQEPRVLCMKWQKCSRLYVYPALEYLVSRVWFLLRNSHLTNQPEYLGLHGGFSSLSLSLSGLGFYESTQFVTNSAFCTMACRWPCTSQCQRVCCHVPGVASTRWNFLTGFGGQSTACISGPLG